MPDRASSKFLELLRKVPRKLREVGPLYTAASIFRRLLPCDVASFYICELDLNDPRHIRDSDPEIRPGLIPEDLDSFNALGAAASDLPARIEPSTRLWVLEPEDRPIAYMWLEPIDFDVDVFGWMRIKILAKDIRGVMLWVAPEYRGQGIGPRLDKHAATECARAGYSRIVSIVDTLNRNSLRADRKVGYKPICHVLGLRFAGFALVYFQRTLRLGRWSSSRPLDLPVEVFDGKRR